MKRNLALRECCCPVCDALLDGATAASSSGRALPKVGDVSICIKCMAVSIFDGTRDRLRLRLPRADEVDAVVDAVRKLRRMH